MGNYIYTISECVRLFIYISADISDDEVVPLRKGTSGKGKDVRVERKNDVERQKIVEQADKEVEKRKTQIENKLIQVGMDVYYSGCPLPKKNHSN